MQIELSLRASDADREEVAERLRHATAEGRLNADELEGRLQSLFVARTYGELNALLVDLPAAPSARRQRPRIARPGAAIAAVTLMLLVLGALAIARVHSAVAVTGRLRGGPPGFPGPLLREFKFRPPLADPTHGLILAGAMAAAVAALLACSVFAWVMMRSRAASDR